MALITSGLLITGELSDGSGFTELVLVAGGIGERARLHLRVMSAAMGCAGMAFPLT